MQVDQFLGAFNANLARPNRFWVNGAFPNSASNALQSLANTTTAAGGLAASLGLGGVAQAAAAVAGLATIGSTAAAILGGSGGSAKVQFLCKAASLPEDAVAKVPVRYQGRTVNLIGDRSYADWTITMYNDEAFSIRNAFQAWSESMNDPVQNTGNVGLGMMLDWQVAQISKNDDTILKLINIHGLFPTLVGPVALSWDNENQVETYDVTFAYQYWTNDTTN